MKGSGEQYNIKAPSKDNVLPEFSDGEFLLNIQKQIVGLLKTDDLTLSDLLSQLHNCDPLFAKKAIEDLISSDIVDFNSRKKQYSIKTSWDLDLTESENDPLKKYRNAHFLAISPSPPSQNALDIIHKIKTNLPEASPVYFQWWFTPASLLLLSNAILARISNSDRVAFIGAPTLGTYVSYFFENRLAVFDVDQTLLNNLKNVAQKGAEFIRYDVVNDLDKELQNKFSIIYLDPPWYLNYIFAFLKRAGELCKQGGLIFVSLPPVNTRSTIFQERERVYKFIKDCGFRIISYWPSAIRYEIPKFESRAYKQSGIELRQPWREGELLLLRKTKNIINADSPEFLIEQRNWSEFIINKCRIFLKKTAGPNKNNDTPIISRSENYDSFYLKTTSLREPARKKADIISSRNHAALVRNKKLIEEILTALSKKEQQKKLGQELFMRYKYDKKELDEVITTLTSFTYNEKS